MLFPMRPSHLWKELPPSTRLTLANAFWREKDDDSPEATVQHVEAIAAIARRMNFRTKSVQALPIDRKARQLAQNPNASLMFPWLALERQVVITGQANKLSTAESLRYFLTRPRESQLSAWASPQSSIISSRKVLEMEWEHLKAKFGAGQIPLPSFWGGYRVYPNTIEFWQGRPNRLHDRFEYTRQADNSWLLHRLAP